MIIIGIFAAQGSSNSGSRTPIIIVPAVLGGLLVLVIIIIALLIVLVMRRRKNERATETHGSAIYSNAGRGSMDNPVYMEHKLFDSKDSLADSSELHFNPHADSNIYEGRDEYATINNGDREFVTSSNANSREDLLYSPLYTTMK